MRTSSIAALCLLVLGEVTALDHSALFQKRHSHHRLHKKYAGPSITAPAIRKRGTCQFPTDKGLVAVAPDKMNAGWAMSPDEPCLP
jgi:hypothetical protein